MRQVRGYEHRDALRKGLELICESRADSQQLFRTGPGPSFVGCYDFEAGFTDAGENLGYGVQGRNHYTDMVFADVVSAAQAAGHRHIALACGAGKF